VRAVDPEGLEWDVSRDWFQVPGWRKRGRLEWDPGVGTAPDFGADDLGIAGAIIVVLLIFFLFLNGFALLVGLAALLAAFGGLVFRIVLGRPWVVQAKSGTRELQWRVRGTLGSRRAIHEVAAAIERGDYEFEPRGAVRSAKPA
jgi:hypothetical protein